MDDAKKLFNKNKTKENYDRTVRKELKRLGKEYGIDIDGEFRSGKGQSSATPNGEEIWAAVHLPKRFQPVMFLGSDIARPGNPDILTSAGYIDIKTIRSERQSRKRLNHAREQCEAMGQDFGGCVVSEIFYEGDMGRIREIYDDFIEDGTLSVLVVIDKKGIAVEV